MGAIPKWAWILLLVVAMDDALAWISTPALAIPLLILLIAFGVLFYSQPALVGSLFNSAQSVARSSISRLATETTTRLITAQRRSV
jgi:uncharacterized protein involved in cysteine biosynthesis